MNSNTLDARHHLLPTWTAHWTFDNGHRIGETFDINNTHLTVDTPYKNWTLDYGNKTPAWPVNQYSCTSSLNNFNGPPALVYIYVLYVRKKEIRSCFAPRKNDKTLWFPRCCWCTYSHLYGHRLYNWLQTEPGTLLERNSWKQWNIKFCLGALPHLEDFRYIMYVSSLGNYWKKIYFLKLLNGEIVVGPVWGKMCLKLF